MPAWSPSRSRCERRCATATGSPSGSPCTPYLHWEREDGTTVRGRENVLAMLAQAPVPEPPAAVELRDGQVYRWMR